MSHRCWSGLRAKCCFIGSSPQSKLKNIRNAVLKDNAPSVTAILNFEKEASKVDIQLRSAAGPNEGMCTHIFRCRSLIIWLQYSRCIILPWYHSGQFSSTYGHIWTAGEAVCGASSPFIWFQLCILDEPMDGRGFQHVRLHWNRRYLQGLTGVVLSPQCSHVWLSHLQM